MTAAAPPAAALDPRVAAFCSPDAVEVFGSVVNPLSIWKPDPLDVEEIHADARETFAGLFHRAAATPRPDFGKVLLVQGVAGSGKTHLMRAFRHFAHTRGGYCGYLQMISQAGDYTRYVLSLLIDSLHHPYLERQGPTPGLTRLAAGLLDVLEQDRRIDREERQQFCEDILDPAEAVRQVNRLADFVVQTGRFDDRDLDLLRALLFLMPSDPRLRGRVLKWLRCEELTPADRDLLGGLAARTADGAALATIAGLARVMAAVHGAPLVLLADQLEETYDVALDEKESGRRFRQAVDTLVNVAAHVPTAVVVVACLEDYYQSARKNLPSAKIDRLEYDPKPVRLTAGRTPDEIQALLAVRLRHLYGTRGAPFDESTPLFPFESGHLTPLAGRTGRVALQWFHDQQQRCMLAGGWVAPGAIAPPPAPPAAPVMSLQEKWNDFRSGYTTPVLDDEPESAELLAWGLQAASAELPDGLHIGAAPDGRFVETVLHFPNNTVEKLLVAVCDKNARGGGLGKQVQEVARRAGELPAVLVRSTPFPASPTALVTKDVLKLIAPKGKGWRVVVENSDWRALHAFRTFHAQHKNDPSFAAWQKDAKPLTDLPAVRAVLALDKLLAELPRHAAPLPPAPPAPPAGLPKPVPASPPAAPAPPPAGPLVLGETRGMSPAPVTLQPQELTQHMAFLGGPGSGKTTAALALIEQLLERGVPAVLLDRKGDLARYADPDARAALPGHVEVALFTPGAAEGRPLGLPVVPPDLGQLPSAEREQLAGYAAAALWQMMGNKAKGQDPRLAILGKAIDVLARAPGRAVTLPALRQLVADQDDALVNEVDGLDAKHFKKLAEELSTLHLQRRRLFEAPEMLDVDLLLGRGPHAAAGKARLTVVNAQFLGDAGTVDFWVAQLLIALGRWKARNPSDRLQAVFLFDEADQYLPAQRAPATKAPMEYLLRQVRSAGVGLFLASQSPGDFDYKCRDLIRAWLVGRVTQPVALQKLKPTLEAAKGDVLGKLAGQGAGEFFLARERDVQPVRTRPSLVATRQLPEERILELARAGRPA